jgi:hypothetical protein
VVVLLVARLGSLQGQVDNTMVDPLLVVGAYWEDTLA